MCKVARRVANTKRQKTQKSFGNLHINNQIDILITILKPQFIIYNQRLIENMFMSRVLLKMDFFKNI